MIKPEIPLNEAERLNSLHEYQILDTLPQDEYDDITAIASLICDTPISLITLVDEKRQWFKSNHGMGGFKETPRELAFCSHGILEPHNTLIVENAKEDQRFKDNPLVVDGPSINFYAGVPLVTKEGFPLGSLCVIDHKPRKISEAQVKLLRSLADQVVKLLELRKTVLELKETQLQLLKSNENLEEFAHIISHDIKAPLRNIRDLSDMIVEDYGDKLDESGKRCLSLLSDTADESVDFIHGVLNYSKATYFLKDDVEEIDLRHFINKLIDKLNPPAFIKIMVPADLPKISISKIALQQTLDNLLSNAIKYNDKPEGLITIDFEETDKEYVFKITDNGQGIPQKDLNKIFTLFYMGNKKDAKSKGSSGIGLSIVKKLVDNLGGKIKVDSNPGEGTAFSFSLLKPS